MIKSYKEYMNESAGVDLTQEQKDWLNVCTKGTWQFNPQTGEVDVQGDFGCSRQGLDSFKGVRFGHVSGGFYCLNNKLTSLEGAPQSVGGDFYCSSNILTSLVGAPQSVDGSFSCSYNELTSLEGAPQSVGGTFYCSGNKLTSLKGFPMEIKGDINLNSNPIWNEIGPMVKSMSDDEKRFFYKFAAADQIGTAESLERIARSIERMRMI